MTVAKRPCQRIEIDDRAAAVIDQACAPFHPAKFGFSDHAGSGRRLRNMQADDVALGQQILQALDGLSVAVAKLVGVVEENYFHAHRFRKHRELRSNIAIADNSECTRSEEHTSE